MDAEEETAEDRQRRKDEAEVLPAKMRQRRRRQRSGVDMKEREDALDDRAPRWYVLIFISLWMQPVLFHVAQHRVHTRIHPVYDVGCEHEQ
ncbi:uncharacterized protein A4U43_C04F29250 [Asparagus officinalis]|uniref:Uncharacterized protein n=1 Tax=Asparagus officinalis TaxID=4686 RepID=A0A5P1F4H0_ASPOF|nr:uncharacterized protein A4U43_C04F29250 [Asparagus officinalis]